MVMDPGKTFLDRCHLETDQAIEDVLQGAIQDGASERVVEDSCCLVDEGVQSIVHGCCTCVYPAEDVLVDIIAHAIDDSVSVVRPFGGRVL